MTIVQNIADREAAESLHKTIGELLRDEVPKLPSDRSRDIFWRSMKASVDRNVSSSTTSLNDRNTSKKPGTVTVKSTVSDEDEGRIDYAISLVDDIEYMEPRVEWPDASDVLAKAIAIGEAIEFSGRVTDAQINALENMKRGMEAWLRD